MSTDESPSALDKWISLKLLRENIFERNPRTYGWTDFAEELPGNTAKTIASQLNDVAPTLAIISRDPEIRRKQIDEAAKIIQQPNVTLKDALGKALHTGKESFIPSLGLSTIFGTINALANKNSRKNLSNLIDRFKNSPKKD